MNDLAANPTDTAICRLLAAGPLPTAALAARLAVPDRTVRHRLYRLRQAGAVVTSPDGLHLLAAPATTTGVAGPLPARDHTATTARIAGPLPARDGAAMALAAPVTAADSPVGDGPSPRHACHWGPRAALAVVAVALAVAGGIAIKVGVFRLGPPASPTSAQPSPVSPPGAAYLYPGDPWGGMAW
jgi:hypothetical protein